MGLAIGAIEAGMCDVVAIFRSMNGYSNVRIGGTGARAAAPIGGPDLAEAALRPHSAPSSSLPILFTRHMAEYGVKSEDLAAIKVAHSNHASNNPKALMKHRVTVDDVMNSRWIIRPVAHLLDCCLGNGQRHLRHRNLRRPRQRPEAQAYLHQGGAGARHQAGRRFPLPAWPHLPGGRPLYRAAHL